MNLPRGLFLLVAVVQVFLLANIVPVLAQEATGDKIQYMSTGDDPAVFVRSKIDSHEVMVFARSYGKDNRRIKELLRELSNGMTVEVEFLDVDLLPGFDGSLVMVELEKLTRKWMFPSIFIGKEHVGGHAEIDQLHSVGELKEMLRQLGQEL